MMNGMEIESGFNDPKLVDSKKVKLYQRNKWYQEFFKRRAARISFLDFVTYTYQDYRVNWHHKLMCATIDDWIAGKIDRLMIFTPPRHGKSLIVSERLPAYLFGLNPMSRIILATHTSILANKMSRRVRECMVDNPYRKVFPETNIGGKHQRFAVQEWETSKKGTQRSCGIGGSIVGMGFDFGLIDDPHKDRKEAESEVIRSGVHDWYSGTFYHRAQKGSKILIIQTRWHPDDLCGHLLEKARTNPDAKQWKVLDLPAILTGKPCKGDIRKKGEALWEDEYPLTDLKTIKIEVGDYNWSSLYQQEPIPEGRSKINRNWFEIIDEKDLPPNLRWHRFWDPAVSTKKEADFTASIKGATCEKSNLYLRDMIHGQWEWPDAYKTIIKTSENERKVSIGFEAQAQQKGFLSELLREPRLFGVPLKGYTVDNDKLTRALPWIARAEAKKVFLVKGSWIANFLTECQNFTGKGDKHDDQIDAVSGVYIMCENSAKGTRKSGTAY